MPPYKTLVSVFSSVLVCQVGSIAREGLEKQEIYLSSFECSISGDPIHATPAGEGFWLLKYPIWELALDRVPIGDYRLDK